MRLLREKCRELSFQSQLIYNFIISSSLGRSERELEQRPKNVMRVPLRGLALVILFVLIVLVTVVI